MIAVDDVFSGSEAKMVTTASGPPLTPLVDLLLEEIRAICRRYPVRELAVFGSALRDDFRPNSDVDLLVEFEPNATVGLMAFGTLQRELEAAFGRRVDLIPKDGLRQFLRDDVLATARTVYVAA